MGNINYNSNSWLNEITHAQQELPQGAHPWAMRNNNSRWL